MATEVPDDAVEAVAKAIGKTYGGPERHSDWTLHARAAIDAYTESLQARNVVLVERIKASEVQAGDRVWHMGDWELVTSTEARRENRVALWFNYQFVPSSHGDRPLLRRWLLTEEKT